MSIINMHVENYYDTQISFKTVKGNNLRDPEL